MSMSAAHPCGPERERPVGTACAGQRAHAAGPHSLLAARQRWVGCTGRVGRCTCVGVAGVSVVRAAALGHRLGLLTWVPHVVVRLLAVVRVRVPAFVHGCLSRLGLLEQSEHAALSRVL